MTIISRERLGHWYRWIESENRAEACYEVPYADPSKGMRPTTLADAKKLGLFPSPTTVLQVLAKPGLTAWLQEQAVLASLTLPRALEPAEQWWGRCISEIGGNAHDGEMVLFWCAENQRRPVVPDDQHAHRIVEDMKAQSEKAKADGTDIHDAIVMLLDGAEPSPKLGIPEHVCKILGPIRDWLRSNIGATFRIEEVVGCPKLKLAGRLDLFAECKGRPAFIDFKGQDVKNGKPVFYDEWPLQLAAYRRMADGPDSPADLVSVVIDRKTGAVHEKVWPQTDDHWKAFEHCHELWKWSNGYN